MLSERRSGERGSRGSCAVEAPVFETGGGKAHEAHAERVYRELDTWSMVQVSYDRERASVPPKGAQPTRSEHPCV